MWLLSNKISVEDSGLLEGFCDYHCHLLPGVDDGVADLRETLQILEKWEQLGMSEVWLTPHVMEDIPNTPDDLDGRFADLTSHYHGNMTLHLAAEHMMDRLFLSRMASKELLPIGMSGSYLLTETSYFNPPINMIQILGMIKDIGYTPVLAHPERYQYMSFADYIDLKQQGVMLQLNLPSLVGAYGLESKKKAEWLLMKNMYDCCGTDTHSLDSFLCFLDGMISKKTLKRLTSILEKTTL